MLLGRLRVRQKLVLLVVPLLLLAVAGAVPLVLSRVQAAERSSDSAALVQRAVRITELVQELQQERLASLGFLSNDVAREDVVARSTRVLELARQIDHDYGAGDDTLSLALRQVTLRSALDGLRPQILEQRTAGFGVYTGFTGAIGGLIDELRLTNDADLRSNAGQQQVALDAIIRHDEATAAEGAALFIEPRREITMRVVGLVGGGLALENREETVFKQLADPSSADLYEQVEASRSSTRLNNYLDGIVGSNASQIDATIAPDLAPQVESLTSLSRLVETRVAAQAVAEADRSARTDRSLAGIVGGVALVLLIAAALLSVLITRSIARPLRRLTASADEVADVAQLELVRVADTDDPEAAVPQLRPVRVGTADEMGELAQAFNRVQQVASNLVERQLVSRQNVATMFGNVGRRTQNLVGRQLAMIDSLERNEQDPALLDRLYRLDHVSTRLRRNANSLVVLSGATEQQITSEPLSVADTIRSALGEIEGFQRVRLGSVDDVLLAPTVTADVILLLAELLENGTSFSPPHTEVEVEARSGSGSGDDGGGGVLIRIVDHGLGMTPEQLEAENARLVSRERLDLAPTDVLGLFVVGRLARRHGIDVRLLPTPGTGVTAEVQIPDAQVVRSDRRVAASAPAPVVAPPVPVVPVVPTAPAPAGPDERGWWDSPTPAADRGAVPSRAAAPASGSSAAGSSAFRSGPAEPAVPRSSNGADAGGNGAVPAGAAAELAAAAEAERTAGADLPEPAPDVPRPRGAAGMVRRVRGAQHPDTGVRDGQPETFRPGSADDARQEIEDFEAGVRRALRETGADGGSGFVVEDGVAPWTDLDAGNPAGAEQTQALVEEFEDGVRRALARLDQVAGRPAEPSALFERRPGTPYYHPTNGTATEPPLPANGAEPPVQANGTQPPQPPATGAAPPLQTDGAEPRPAANGAEPQPPADDAGAEPPLQADGAEPPLQADGAEPRPPANGAEPQPPADDAGAEPPLRAEGAEPRPPANGAEPRPPADDAGAEPPLQADGARAPLPADDGEPWPPAHGADAEPPLRAADAESSPEAAGVEPPQRANGAEPPQRANGAEPPLQADGAEQPVAPRPMPRRPGIGTGSPASAPTASAEPAAGPPPVPPRPAEGAEPAAGPRPVPPRPANGAGLPMGPPRRLDAGSGARRPVEAATNHPDPRPLERRRPPEPPQYRAAVPPFPPAQPPFPPAAQAPFRPPTPAAEPETAPQDPPSGPAAADSPAGARQAGTSIEAGDSQDEADKSAEEGGSSGADNGVAGAGTGEPVAEGEHEHPSSRGNGTGPNGRVANDPDEGKMDPSGRGLVRRVPGAQMPAGALAARPGTPTQAPPDTAEQDAAAARSLVEEFEAGVQRALRDAPGTVETDEDGVR